MTIRELRSALSGYTDETLVFYADSEGGFYFVHEASIKPMIVDADGGAAYPLPSHRIPGGRVNNVVILS